MQQNEKSLMLGTMKMSKLVPTVAIPIMISLLVQALYNIVDSIFVAKYSPDALTAVSLAYPIQMLMIAVSTGLGTGINALASRLLGERNAEKSVKAAGNGLTLMIAGFLIFLVFGLFFADDAFRVLTKDETLRELGEVYLSTVCIFSFGLFATILFERLMQSISSVMNVAFNAILIVYGKVAINILGIYFKLQSFIFMPIFGLSNGLVPIIGYNYGARNRERIYSAIKTALVMAMSIMVVGMAIFIIFPGKLLSLFESGSVSEITTVGSIALKTISLHFPLAAIGITLSTTFQAIGKGMYSMIMSICRQLVVLIPAAWILSKFGGLNVIWWSFIIAEGVCLVICLFMYNNVNQRIFKRL